jgi:hypothetical protein
MIRPFAFSLAAGLALLTPAFCRADETFPVVHKEPITVRILSGKNGLPLSNLHLVLVGGYDQSELHDQIFREEVLTDAFGNVRLSNQLANLPWLQVWVSKMPLCQSNPRKTSFSVELIRRDGLSAPNLCGPVSAQNAPGVFSVFVKNKAKKLHKGLSVSVETPMAPVKAAPVAAPVAISAAVVTSPVVPQPVVAASQALPVTHAEPPVEATPKVALVIPAAEPEPVELPAIVPVFASTNPVVHLQTRRVAAKRAVHRARLVPATCSAQPPASKPAPKTPAKDESVKPQKTPISATRRSKPLAGARLAVKRRAHPTAPLKQD